ncbi:P27 family phage terminase small subunit [Thermodesulfobacteriota bacterium]
MKKAPKHLKKQGRKFWKSVLSDFVLKDSHHLVIFENACQCLDRIDEAQAEIKVQGAYYTDRFGQPKEHPAHKTERDNKILFARLLRELNLDIEPLKENRPPALYS